MRGRKFIHFKIPFFFYVFREEMDSHVSVTSPAAPYTLYRVNDAHSVEHVHDLIVYIRGVQSAISLYM